MLNRICAYPLIIVWILGACLLNAVLIGLLLHDVPLRVVVADRQVMLYLLAAFIPATLLGFFVGGLAFGRVVLAICSRINGAPLRIGDRVVVLSGPHKGTVAQVYDIDRDQAGSEVARLDMGAEARERFGDIFQEYSVLRMHRSKQDRVVNWTQLAEDSGVRSRVLLLMCAYPGVAAFTGMLAVSALSALLILWLLHGAPSRNIAPYVSGCLFFVALTGLVVAIIVCGRIRGVPFRPGDQVMILSGASRGITGEVSGIVLQNYGPLVFVDLGPEDNYAFDEKSLLKIRKNEPGGAANRGQQSEKS